MEYTKILITGGMGFIGYHLAKYLLEHSHAELALVDNLERGRLDGDATSLLEDPRITFLNHDLTEPTTYEKLGSGYGHVYHLAAINGTRLFYEKPHEVLRVNTLSLVYMLEWFRRENSGGTFCFTSSNEVYAGGLSAFGVLPLPTPEGVPFVIDDPYNARWSYASTKMVGELFTIHYAQKYGFRALIIRPHNVYGPRAGYHHVIPELSIRIHARKDPFPMYGAEDTRTFCYISDAVRAMVMLMESPHTKGDLPETVHIGNTEEIAIRELAEKLFMVAGWRPQRIDVHPSPSGSVRRRRADIAKLQRLTGWKPEVSLLEGLQRTYAWYAMHPKAEPL